jgi:hypothetical protein
LNTSDYFLFLFLFCCCALAPVAAQSTYQVGILPAVNLNVKKDKWSFNYKIESRQLLQRGTFNSDQEYRYQYVLTDNSIIAARKVGLNARLSGGYLLRLREGAPIHRFIQQYAITQKLPSIRLSHRVVTDQTITTAEATEYRARYRIATELPLNGQSADEGEWYLKFSNEYLNKVQENTYDLEIRILSFLGYIVSKNQRIEVGLDYWADSLINPPIRHSFWTSLNWFINI